MKKFRKLFAIFMTLGLLVEGSPASTLAEPLPPKELPTEVSEPEEETENPDTEINEDQTADEDQSTQPQDETDTSFEDAAEEDPAAEEEEPAAEDESEETADEEEETTESSSETEEEEETQDIAEDTTASEDTSDVPVSDQIPQENKIALSALKQPAAAAAVNETEHVHEWVFKDRTTADHNYQITATCKNSDGKHDGDTTATLTLIVHANRMQEYNGAAVTAEVDNNIEGLTPSPVSFYRAISLFTDEYELVPEAKNVDQYKAEVKLGDQVALYTFTLFPKEIDLNWSNTELTYNGQTQKPTAAPKPGELFEGDTCEVTVSGEKKDVGNYTASASLSNSNYSITYSDTATASFSIKPKPVTVSGITVAEKVYDGNTEATLTADQAKINGLYNDDQLTFTATGTFADANVGKDKPVNTEFTLGGNSANNYTLSPDTPLTGTITPKEVTVSWDDATPEFVYDGQEHAPTATAGNLVDGDTCEVIVSGAKNAGTHTATVSGLSNSNYKLPTGITGKTFTIEKAPLTYEMFTVALPASTEYDGTPKTASVKVADGYEGVGTPTIVYYQDNKPLDGEPTELGSYEVRLNVTEGDNYFSASALEGFMWRFDITKKTPVISNEPKDGTLVYTGEDIPLLSTPATATGGTVFYSLDGTTWSENVPTGKEVGAYTLYYKVTATDEDYSDIPEKTVTITIKETKDKPSGLTATKANNDTSKDAVISGVDNTMEYSTDNGKTYTDVKGSTIDSLGKGDVLVRYKETDTTLASDPVTVTIQVKQQQAAPTGLYASDASSESIADGRIYGVNDLMEYSVDGNEFYPVVSGATTISGLYSGKVYVRYKGIEDLAPSPLTEVVIYTKDTKKYNPTPESVNQVWKQGSNSDLIISVKDNHYDIETFDLFTGIKVDGTAVEQSDSTYTATKGSVVIAFKPAYLKTLSTGEHELTVLFKDGEAHTTFSIAEEQVTPDEKPDPKPEPKPDPKPDSKTDPKPAPANDQKTDKKADPVKDFVITCQMAGYPSNYAWNENAKACQMGYLDNNGVFHSTAVIKKAGIPNTYDVGVAKYLWAFIASALAAFICSIVLVRDDHD